MTVIIYHNFSGKKSLQLIQFFNRLLKNEKKKIYKFANINIKIFE